MRGMRWGVSAAWLAVALAGMTGCKSGGPGSEPADRMTMGPTVGSYDQLMIDAVEVTFDPTSKDIEANAKEVEMLKDTMRGAVVKAVSDRYKVVENPGPGVMRVKMTIADVKKGEPLMHLHWSTKLLGLGLGGATMRGEMTDSLTGAELGTSFISKRGNFFQLTEGLTKWGEAQAVMKEWAKEFRKKLDEVHGKR